MTETLVEALERVFPLIEYEVSYDNSPALIAEKAPALLPLLVAHATEAERAALLRTLLVARLEGLGMPSMSLADQVEAGKALAGLERHAELSIGEAYALSQRAVDLLAPEAR